MRERQPRLPAHQVTTRNLGAAYPFVAEAGLGERGVVDRRDLLGGSFVFDPFELYAAGVVSNPNMVVFGQIGRGKSAFVKTFLWREAVFGRRAWVVDPKGEYGDLAAAWGVRPVASRPGGAIRLNPLDPGPERADHHDGEDVTGRRRPSCWLRSAQPAWAGTWFPASGRRSTLRWPRRPGVGRSHRARRGRRAAVARPRRPARCAPTAQLPKTGVMSRLELRRLVHGDLRGMFDGPTTAGLDLSAPLVVLDLSALYSSAALGVLMACATAWLQAALTRADAGSPSTDLPGCRRGMGHALQGGHSRTHVTRRLTAGASGRWTRPG